MLRDNHTDLSNLICTTLTIIRAATFRNLDHRTKIWQVRLEFWPWHF